MLDVLNKLGSAGVNCSLRVCGVAGSNIVRESHKCSRDELLTTSSLWGWASPWRIGERHGLQGHRGSNPEGIHGFSSIFSPSDAFP